MTTHRRTFPGQPQELRAVRRWVRAVLPDHPRADDAELIATELSTNAVRHTSSGDPGGSFHVTVHSTARSLAVAVTDEGTTGNTPHIHCPAPDSTRGRGLDIVKTIADALTIQGTPNSRTVAAVLILPAQARAPEAHSTRRPTPPPLTIGRPGYRCECHAQSPTTGPTPALITISDATSAEQAVRWIRRYVTTLLTTVDPTTHDQLTHWAETDHTKALDDLQRGQPYALTTSYADTHLEWTARPVIYLPLLPPLGKPILRYALSCAHQYRTHSS